MNSLEKQFTGEQSKAAFATALSLLLFLFCLRVLGQIAVVLWHPVFLPPSEDWLSGLMPYPELLCCQILIIALFGKIIADISFIHGFFSRTHYKLGAFLRGFGSIYLFVMILRYVIRMFLYPQERWTGGAIPIFFHCVLATFILTLSFYYLKGQPLRASGCGGKFARLLFVCLTCTGICLWSFWQILPSAIASCIGLRVSNYAVRIEPSVPLTLTDGVTLKADIFHPLHLRTSSTILVRIPFTKTLKNSFMEAIMGRIWSERGYTVVVQGTRGRAGSGGAFYPMVHEQKDGLETVLWLRKQPWFNGKIYTWGGSAFGQTALVLSDLSVSNKPLLSGICAYESSTQFHDMFYPGGAFSLFSALAWATMSAGPSDLPEWPKYEFVKDAAMKGNAYDADVRTVGHKIDFYRDWMLHTTKDAYWKQIDGVDRASNFQAPVLSMAGWYDPFLSSQIEDWQKVTKSSRTCVRVNSRLIIGPWAHGHEVVLPGGGNSGNFRLTTFAESLPFFDHTSGADLGDQKTINEKPVKIFVMGVNQWRYETEFPLIRAREIALRFQSETEMNSFEYAPNRPVPTCGGAMIGCEAAAENQTAIEKRNDVLTFTTTPMTSDVEVTGFVRARLFVKTTAKSADFTVKLVDVFPDGRAINIADGILRRDYACSKKSSTPVEIKVELFPTSNVFVRGHRLRVEIASSNFPRYDRNLDAANQQVFSGDRYPSGLLLPVINAQSNTVLVASREHIK